VAVMGFKCRTMQLQGEVESLRRKLSETVRVAATSLDTNMELDRGVVFVRSGNEAKVVATTPLDQVHRHMYMYWLLHTCMEHSTSMAIGFQIAVTELLEWI